MKAIQIIAQDLFDKVRSRFSNLEMGDEAGAVTIDPAEARFFDFDFVSEGNDLGRVSISLNDLGSLKIYYSQGITENQDDPAKKLWYSFLKEMRYFAMRRLLRFDTRDIAKTNLDKNDFQHLAATQGPKEEPEMTTTMNESRWNQKSTKKTSRAVQGKTEVIVRHAKAVDEEYAGSRSQRKNIKAIFIQNAEGERFKYPFIHPAGAFAMAQHVDHGGIPHDPAGKAIIKMSEQIAQLQEFQRKIQRTSLHDDATGITERAVGRLQELKAQIEGLSKRHHYECWMAEFNEQEHMDDDIMELDAVTMEQYKQTFTQSTFQEELTGYFPLLHRIMSETNKVDLEDYVKEDDTEEIESTDEVKESAFAQFEEWAEATEQGKLTDDEIQALKQALVDLPEGQLDLDTAYNFFSEFGIDDSDLEDKFRQAQALDSTTDSIEVFKLWANENYPELLVALGMSDTQAPVEPAPEVGAEPAPEQPVAEGPADEPVHPDNDADDKRWDDMDESPEDSTYYQVAKILADKGIKYDSSKEGELINAIGGVMANELGMDKKQVRYLIRYDDDFLADTLSALSHMTQGISESMDVDNVLAGIEKDIYSKGLKGEDALHQMRVAILDAALNMVGREKRSVYEPDVLNVMNWDDAAEFLNTVARDAGTSENSDMVPPPGAMEEGKESMVQEVAKIVKSFYNRDNPEVGPFRGEEGIVIDVEKQISEKFGDDAGQQAGKMAEAFMQKLTQEWQKKHGNVANGHGDDGLARLKELVGNIKSKVEGIGDQGTSGRDFNNNIMSAENGPDKSQVPAYKRKEQGGDWKMSTKDLEKEKTNSPTSSAGLARKKAELGISEELAVIMKLSGLAK